MIRLDSTLASVASAPPPPPIQRPASPAPASPAAPSPSASPEPARAGYGAPCAGPIRSGSPSSLLAVRTAGTLDVPRLREAFRACLADAWPALDQDDLLKLQAVALSAVRRLFTNPGRDEALTAAVEKKLAFYRDHDVGPAVASAIFGRDPADVSGIQLDAMNLLLRTFVDSRESDKRLRLAIYDKMATMGRRQDVPALLIHFRRATTPADFFGAQCAIQGIAARTGSPVERRDLSEDPEIGPHLDGPLRPAELRGQPLDPDARRRVIEAVLQRGAIEKLVKFKAGEVHAQGVWVVTFKEKLPGEGPIKGAYKPENIWLDKPECWASREVLAYALDKEVLETGRINPTVEAILPMPDPATNLPGSGPTAIGSISFWEPRCGAYGHRAPGHERDGAAPRDTIPPEYQGLAAKPWFQEQFDELRCLAYLMNNADMIKNHCVPKNNFSQILVVEEPRGGQSLRAVDWSSALGGDRDSGGYFDLIEDEFLPNRPPPSITRALASIAPGQLTELASRFIRPADAAVLELRLDGMRRRWGL